MRTLEHINIKYFKYACPEIGKETPVDINAKCVICGDSTKNKRQKRLHLYTKSNYDHDAIKCFNCDFTGNMYSFLREVDSTLFERYKKEMREKSFNNLKKKYYEKDNDGYQNDKFSSASISLGNYTRKKNKSISTDPRENVTKETDIKVRKSKSKYKINFSDFNEVGLEKNVERQDDDRHDSHKTQSVFSSDDHVFPEIEENPKRVLGTIPPDVFAMPEQFVPACESEDAVKYLEGRGIDPKYYWWSDDWLKFKGKNMPLKRCIIIPLWVLEDDDVIYGFQARSIDSKFFYTFIPDENSGFKVWNWYGIDKTKPTFIFESAFDAESSGLPRDRICAALGADLNNIRLAELSEPIFCLDNQREDQTSKNKTIQLLKRGFRCFIWDKDMPYKDTNDAIRDGVSKREIAKYIISHISSGMTAIMKVKLRR